MQGGWNGQLLYRYPIIVYPVNKDIISINSKSIPPEVAAYSDPARGLLSLIVDTNSTTPPIIWCYAKTFNRQPKGAIACIADELREALGLDKWGMHWMFRNPSNTSHNDPLIYLYMYRQGWQRVEPDINNPEYCTKLRKIFCIGRILGVTIQEKNIYTFRTSDGELKVLPRYENFHKYDATGILSNAVLKKWFYGKLTVRNFCIAWFTELFPELQNYSDTDFVERATHIFQDIITAIIQRVDPRLSWIISDIIRRLRECLTV